MRLDLQLIHTPTGATIKHATIKVPDHATRTSLVILAKKWASVSGVKSTTQPKDINTFIIHIPTSDHMIEVERNKLDATYADQLVMQENKHYVWYVPEVSYGTKVQNKVLKGVWR